MKFVLVFMLVLGSTTAMARNVNDFNKALMDDVKKDIATDNDQNLKSENSRAPASVVESEDSDPVIEEDLEVNTAKQLGPKEW